MRTFNFNHFSRSLISVLSAAVISMTLGCALFSRSSDQPDNADFKSSTTVSTASLAPVPVEIADDIAKISAGEPIVPPQAAADAEAPAKNPAEAAPATPGQPPVAAVKVDAKAKDAARDPSGCACNVNSAGKSGKSINYVVHRGDTLMKIAFAKYGNLYRWKEIYEANKTQLPQASTLTPGSVLRINNVEYVVILKNGEPFLIKRGDTLVKIAKNVYGQPSQWKTLWQNNKQMIHNPNKIYAGFTLYYQPHKIDQPILRPPASTK